MGRGLIVETKESTGAMPRRAAAESSLASPLLSWLLLLVLAVRAQKAQVGAAIS